MIEQHVFNNRYRLDSKLGEGGMATVYCGTDTLLRRRVAIKVLRPQYASDEEFVRRFYQEAESAAKLSHPNIVNTYDVGREDDTYFIVMELVDGPSLAEIIAADGRLPEPVAIDYAAQICNGLAYAHRQGLLHRDIKPANILVTKDDVVKLSDFGIARAVSQQTMAMTKPGLVMGSVFYLSPEQAQGHKLHETSDLYSVGIVLYQMLTGKLPYSGESPVTVALKHISDPVPTIDTEQLGVSPALAAIVNKLLQKRPEHRFASASEVASALREARERPSHAAYDTMDDAPTQMFGAVTAPQPPPRPSRMPDSPYAYTSIGEDDRRSSRSSVRIAAMLVGVLALAIVLGFILFGHPPIPNPLAHNVRVADYTNMTDSQAQQAIVNAGLSYKFIPRSSDTIPANKVISQDRQAGSSVPKGTVVKLYVSNGLPTVGLRDVRGYTFSDAQKDLQGDKFKVKQQRVYNGAAKDSVIAEKPSPGTRVRQNSTVTLVVSNGPQPVAMPNVVAMQIDAAQKLAQQDGFTLIVQQQSMDNVPPNVIASQDVSPGTALARGGSVHVVVSTGGNATQVPDLSRQGPDEATQALAQAGFTPKLDYEIHLSDPSNGQIIRQDPAPGTALARGSTVTMYLSVPGAVPDTNGMTLDAAQAALRAAGYTPGNITYSAEGFDGKVVRTEPEVGTQTSPGATVNLIVNKAGEPTPQ
ncbi:MAG TPA: Stk1 family PASTA domain-containing Ser/Thr kinase [Candidatus Baltobacteraceae bacterium]